MSVYDIHETFQDILVSFSRNYVRPSQLKQTRGLTLFKKLPVRTCVEVEVSQEFCACTPPIEYTSNSSFITLAAEAVVEAINSWLPPVCDKLKLFRVIASGSVSDRELSHENNENDEFPAIIIVGFITVPGYFRFEASVSYEQTSGKFIQMSQVLRTHKVNRSTECLGDEFVFAELYCFCHKMFGIILASQTFFVTRFKQV